MTSAGDTAPSGTCLLIAWGAARLSGRLILVAERVRCPRLALAALWASERCAELARRLLVAAAALMLVAGTAGAVDPFQSDDKLIYIAAQLCAEVAREHNPAVVNSAQLMERTIENCRKEVNGTPRNQLKNYAFRLCVQIIDYSVCARAYYDK